MTDKPRPKTATCNHCLAVQPAHLVSPQSCPLCESRLTADKKPLVIENRDISSKIQKEKLERYEENKKYVKEQSKEEAFNVRAAAGRELAKRELARRRFLPFVQRFHPEYLPGWFHKDLCLRLERFSQDIIDKKSPRLILEVPPRHGKSLTTSKTFPAWHLGRQPTHEFICCSYSGSLANDFSRDNRSILRDPDYANIFKTRLDKDSQSIEHWLTNEKGGFTAAGVGGAITGKGANCLLIDDPVKNREEAESFNTRQAIKSWYTSTAYTRLAPGGGVLIIMTRWHDDDLAGWLLEQGKKGGDEWEEVKYPAIAEQDELYRFKGEALHPVRYGEKALAKIARAVGPRDWEALYQQNPVAQDGDFFKTDDFRSYKPADLALRRLGNDLEFKFTYFTAWDLAIGKKQQNDWTVGITVAIDSAENIWLVDVARGRWDAMEIVDRILEVHNRWNASITGIEKGHIQSSIGPFLRKRIQETRTYSLNIEELSPGRADKVARAASIQGRARQGMLYVPELAPWAQNFINEALRFPNGVHDDQVDAISWIGYMLDKFFVTYKPKAKPPKSWKDKLAKIARASTSGSHMAS